MERALASPLEPLSRSDGSDGRMGERRFSAFLPQLFCHKSRFDGKLGFSPYLGQVGLGLSKYQAHV